MFYLSLFPPTSIRGWTLRVFFAIIAGAFFICADFGICAVESTLFAIMFFFGLAAPAAAAIVLDSQHKNAGTAAALLGALPFAAGSGGGLFHSHNIWRSPLGGPCPYSQKLPEKVRPIDDVARACHTLFPFPVFFPYTHIHRPKKTLGV